MDIEAMTAEVGEWLGQYVPGATPLQVAAKVCEEAGELIACEINDGRSIRSNRRTEVADVLIAVLAYMATVGINPAEAYVAKMRELWER